MHTCTHPGPSLLPSTRPSPSGVSTAHVEAIPRHPIPEDSVCTQQRTVIHDVISFILQTLPTEQGFSSSADRMSTLPPGRWWEKSEWLSRAVIRWNKDSPASHAILVAPANVTELTRDLGRGINMFPTPGSRQRSCSQCSWPLRPQYSYQRQKGRDHLFFIPCLLSALPHSVPMVWTTFCENMKRWRGPCHLGKSVAG